MRFRLLVAAISIATMCNAANFDEIVDSIYSNNIEVKAIEHRLAGDAAAIRSTNNLEATSIDFEYLFGQKAVGDKYAIGIAQGFEWLGVYSSRNKRNNASISALTYAATAQKIGIRQNIEQICIDLVYINKQIALKRQLQNNMLTLRESYNKGFNKGEITIIDINKLNITILDIDRTLKSLYLQQNALFESLKAANSSDGLTADILNLLTEYPNSGLKDFGYYANIIEHFDPDIRSSQAAGEASKWDASTAKMQNLPSFAVGYKYVDELGDKFHGITASLSIPIFSNRHKTKSSRAYSIAAQYATTQLNVSKLTQLSSDYKAALSLQEQIGSYKNTLTDENIAVLNKALNASQISLLDYIMEVNFFIEATDNLLSMEHEYQSLLSKINKYSCLIN